MRRFTVAATQAERPAAVRSAPRPASIGATALKMAPEADGWESF
jgi:hypothetical protein